MGQTILTYGGILVLGWLLSKYGYRLADFIGRFLSGK